MTMTTPTTVSLSAEAARAARASLDALEALSSSLYALAADAGADAADVRAALESLPLFVPGPAEPFLAGAVADLGSQAVALDALAAALHADARHVASLPDSLPRAPFFPAAPAAAPVPPLVAEILAAHVMTPGQEAEALSRALNVLDRVDEILEPIADGAPAVTFDPAPGADDDEVLITGEDILNTIPGDVRESVMAAYEKTVQEDATTAALPPAGAAPAAPLCPVDEPPEPGDAGWDESAAKDMGVIGANATPPAAEVPDPTEGAPHVGPGDRVGYRWLGVPTAGVVDCVEGYDAVVRPDGEPAELHVLQLVELTSLPAPTPYTDPDWAPLPARRAAGRMRREELVALAEERGVAVFPDWTKGQIMDALGI